MKVYLAHSTSYDYENELYKPLRQIGREHDMYFPHDVENDGRNSKDVISASDIVLAEVSYPSTGQGIELGWADSKNIPIVCMYQSGRKPSAALNAICKDYVEYSSGDDLLNKIDSILSK